MGDERISEDRMEAVSAAIQDAMERAAMAGLCRDGQLEMAAQAVRGMHPGLGTADLLALLEAEAGAGR